MDPRLSCHTVLAPTNARRQTQAREPGHDLARHAFVRRSAAAAAAARAWPGLVAAAVWVGDSADDEEGQFEPLQPSSRTRGRAPLRSPSSAAAHRRGAQAPTARDRPASAAVLVGVGAIAARRFCTPRMPCGTQRWLSCLALRS